MSTLDMVKQTKVPMTVESKTINADSGCHRCIRKMASRGAMLFILGLLIGLTTFNLVVLLFQHISVRVASETYRWYRTPQDCLKSTSKLGEMVDLAERASKALERLNMPAPVCYGTLWGVLRYEDILPWDTNIDFCVMNERIQNVPVYDLQKAFAEEGVLLHDFTYSRGSYRFRRGSAEGHINVFANCTDIVPVLYPELNIPTLEGDEGVHWACAYSLSSLIGQYTHDLNRPFPSWILTPPFAKKKLAYANVYVPHDGYEIQKYLYPDDWWVEAKPLGCL